jgi:hypothetical protein
VGVDERGVLIFQHSLQRVRRNPGVRTPATDTCFLHYRCRSSRPERPPRSCRSGPPPGRPSTGERSSIPRRIARSNSRFSSSSVFDFSILDSLGRR